MTRTAVTIGVIVALLVLMFAVRTSISSRRQSQAKGRETYIGLRNLMLTGSRSKFSLAPTSGATDPWGVVMDWNVGNATATVVSMADGGASIYLSSGGGYLGGIGQEPIREAAKKALVSAAAVQSQMSKTETFPLPVGNQVRFYLLTDAGVFTTTAPEPELRSGTSPFSNLGNAMQEVVTQYRIFQQKQQGPQS